MGAAASLAGAVALNLISVGATYGVLVLVWQHGHGSHAIRGLPATGAITNWVPLIAFAFPYGLSMDYEAFILTRIGEEHGRTGSTTGVIEGIACTGRLLLACLVRGRFRPGRVNAAALASRSG